MGKLPHNQPDIRLFGDIDDDSFHSFQRQLEELNKDALIVFELTTNGGDADVGRRIACDIKFLRRLEGYDFYFLGKTNVYSIGAVIMSAFPKEKRFLACNTRLMIHERRIDKEVHFDSALNSSIQSAEELLSNSEQGISSIRKISKIWSRRASLPWIRFSKRRSPTGTFMRTRLWNSI